MPVIELGQRDEIGQLSSRVMCSFPSISLTSQEDDTNGDTLMGGYCEEGSE